VIPFNQNSYEIEPFDRKFSSNMPESWVSNSDKVPKIF